MSESNPITDTVVSTLVSTDTSANSIVAGGAGAGATSGTGGFKGGVVAVTGNVSDGTGSMATIRAGGIGIASQAALDLITASSATQLARTAHGTGLQYPRINAGATAWEFASIPGGMTLLGASSGTSTAAGATNVATVAISGLTALDSLYVIIAAASATQDTAGVQLYDATDGTSITAAAVTVVAGTLVTGPVIIMRTQTSNTVIAVKESGANSWAATVVTPVTLTAGWTNAWTLALRHGGVTAGGTFSFTWAVYKLAGQ